MNKVRPENRCVYQALSWLYKGAKRPEEIEEICSPHATKKGVRLMPLLVSTCPGEYQELEASSLVLGVRTRDEAENRIQEFISREVDQGSTVLVQWAPRLPTVIEIKPPVHVEAFNGERQNVAPISYQDRLNRACRSTALRGGTLFVFPDSVDSSRPAS